MSVRLKHLQGEHDELKRKYDEVSASSTTKFQEGMDAAYKAMKIAKGLSTPTKGQKDAVQHAPRLPL